MGRYLVAAIAALSWQIVFPCLTMAQELTPVGPTPSTSAAAMPPAAPAAPAGPGLAGLANPAGNGFVCPYGLANCPFARGGGFGMMGTMGTNPGGMPADFTAPAGDMSGTGMAVDMTAGFAAPGRCPFGCPDCPFHRGGRGAEMPSGSLPAGPMRLGLGETGVPLVAQQGAGTNMGAME